MGIKQARVSTVYTGEFRSQSQCGKGTVLISVVLNEFPNIASRSQKRRAWSEIPRNRKPFWSSVDIDIPCAGNMGSMHHVSLIQVSLASEIAMMGGLKNEVCLVIEDD